MKTTTTKSAKASMVIFMLHKALKKVEFINFDYIAWFDMAILTISLISAIFFRVHVNLAWYPILFALISLPGAALIEKVIQYTLKELQSKRN